jgi:hypothetical protein
VGKLLWHWITYTWIKIHESHELSSRSVHTHARTHTHAQTQFEDNWGCHSSEQIYVLCWMENIRLVKVYSSINTVRKGIQFYKHCTFSPTLHTHWYRSLHTKHTNEALLSHILSHWQMWVTFLRYSLNVQHKETRFETRCGTELDRQRTWTTLSGASCTRECMYTRAAGIKIKFTGDL